MTVLSTGRLGRLVILACSMLRLVVNEVGIARTLQCAATASSSQGKSATQAGPMAIIIVVILNTANSVATVEMGSSMMQLERSVIMDIYIMEHQPTHVLLIALTLLPPTGAVMASRNPESSVTMELLMAS
jgi:hypothetical protein